MRILILIICITFFSCKSSHTRWQEKGIKEGWITYKPDSIQASILPDTAGGNKVIDQFSQDVGDIIQKDCPDIDTTKRREIVEKIKWKVKKEFVPTYIRTAYPDTTIKLDGVELSLSFDTTGKIFQKVKYHKQEVHMVNDRFWSGFRWGFFSTLALPFLCFLFWFFKGEKKKTS